MTDAEDWERKDVWLAALFLFVGTLLVLAAVLARSSGFPAIAWLAFGLPGGVLLLLGANALYRSLRAGE